MLRYPNECYDGKSNKELEKRNQLGRKFSSFFNILLNMDYYEGTKLGRYFYEVRPDGTSEIYVKDPLESELDKLVMTESNEIRYLVGYTGMGKTTLLRNYFRVLDRKVHIRNNMLVLNISFYYAALSADRPQKSVEDEIVRYLTSAIETLIKINKKIVEKEDEFWDGLYDYIEKNKPVILRNEELRPGISLRSLVADSDEKSIDEKLNLLTYACQNSRLEYYSCILKYVLNKINDIDKVVFVFDDIESKEAIFHRPVVELARHLHACFSCIDDRRSWVKTIVSLRAYTFRSNIDRQVEARREQIEKNTILKKSSVSIHDIFCVRLEAIENKIRKNSCVSMKAIQNRDEAIKQLHRVENQLEQNFGDSIYKLANCNLVHAMKMYHSVLVNVEWIAPRESEKDGAFKVSASNYRLTSKTIFHAIACGNEITYLDDQNNLFANLLHNKEEGQELMNLLIIKYLKQKGAYKLYGEKYVQGEDIINDITYVFVRPSDLEIKLEKWQAKIQDSLKYFYERGILLQSIYDIEVLRNEQIERYYLAANKMYLSPRAQFLYSLLGENALLLEMYRDNIYTDIINNDKLTCNMKTGEVIIYLLAYIERLFAYEKRYIGEALDNLSKYQELFGKELLVTPLLEGVVKNIHSYYPDEGKEYVEIMEYAHKIIGMIKEYINIIEEEYGVRFLISNYLEDEVR